MNPPPSSPPARDALNQKTPGGGEGFFFVAYIIGYKNCNGVGLKSEHLKFIDSTNFFSYTYHTDHKNGFGCPELVNLNKSSPDTFLILFLPIPK